MVTVKTGGENFAQSKLLAKGEFNTILLLLVRVSRLDDCLNFGNFIPCAKVSESTREWSTIVIQAANTEERRAPKVNSQNTIEATVLDTVNPH